MGANHTIVLDPQCPDDENPDVLGFLRLATALTNARWAALELQPNGTAPAREYRNGSGRGKAVAVSLEVGPDFDAILSIGTASTPKPEIVGLLSEGLARVLELLRMRTHIELLRGAMDTTSSSILIFDGEGEILFANPPADHLLSLQTEDELLADCNSEPRQPLFTLLSSLVDRVSIADGEESRWKGAIEFAEGRVMACEVMRLPTPGHDGSGAVLVVLQPTDSDSGARVQAFSSSHGLSPRERDVLRLLGRGLTTVAMAEELGISPHTVRDHLKHLYRKTGTKGRSELLGLISRTSGAGVEG